LISRQVKTVRRPVPELVVVDAARRDVLPRGVSDTAQGFRGSLVCVEGGRGGMRSAVVPVIAALLVPLGVARASGGHDAVGCVGCHPRSGGGGWFLLAGNRKYLSSATNRPYTGKTAFCLACHQTPEAGGRGVLPVFEHVSHPFSIAPGDPSRSAVPADLLVNGRIECLSCHDPHPANGSYKYLRGEVDGPGPKLDRFCARCHPAKAG
jgi:hypothetical protein